MAQYIFSMQDVSKTVPPKRQILKNIYLSFFPGAKIGVLGVNGSGKSTLLKIMAGVDKEYDGKAIPLAGTKIGYLPQEPQLDPHKNVRENIEEGLEDLPLLARFNEISLRFAEPMSEEEMTQLLDEQGELQQKIDAAGLWELDHKLEIAADALRLPPWDADVTKLSGGERRRVALCRLLLAKPDMLLLDEPTNHLDLDAIVWLEKWLQKFQGALLIISHDRVFLDNCVDKVIHIENQQLKIYQGNYSAFEKIHAEQLALQQKMHEKQQRQIEHMMSFVNRFKAKASKAKQAQSRLKAIQKLDLIAAAQVDSPFDFEFPEIEPPPNPLLTLTDVFAGYSVDKPVLQKANLQIYPGMRMGLLGANGAGKSTLMKTLSGKLTPLSGTVYIAAKVKLGYYAQHQIEQLNFSQTPLWHLQQLASNAPPTRLRQFLGGFGFSGDMALSVISHFSGGEKARLALALLVWEAPNLLLLDEPTNHLDLEMRNALNLALQSFAGALVLVSHDRYLLQTATDELFLISDNTLKSFSGDLNDYQKCLLSMRESQSANLEKKPKSSADKRKFQEQIIKLEKQLQKLQNEKLQIEQALSDNNIYQADQKNRLTELLQKQTQIDKKISETEALWFKVSEEL